MKLSVTSFRAHSSAQKKILKYQNQLNYVTTHVPVVPNINSSSTVSTFLFLFRLLISCIRFNGQKIFIRDLIIKFDYPKFLNETKRRQVAKCK